MATFVSALAGKLVMQQMRDYLSSALTLKITTINLNPVLRLIVAYYHISQFHLNVSNAWILIPILNASFQKYKKLNPIQTARKTFKKIAKRKERRNNVRCKPHFN